MLLLPSFFAVVHQHPHQVLLINKTAPHAVSVFFLFDLYTYESLIATNTFVVQYAGIWNWMSSVQCNTRKQHASVWHWLMLALLQRKIGGFHLCIFYFCVEWSFLSFVETDKGRWCMTSMLSIIMTDLTRTGRTSDVITMTFNAFSAAGYCRQLKADCRELQKEADALRTELQSLSAEIK